MPWKSAGKRKEEHRRWRERHPDYNRKWKNEHRERVKEMDKKYRIEHRQLYINRCKDWRKINPNYQRDYMKDLYKDPLFRERRRIYRRKATASLCDGYVNQLIRRSFDIETNIPKELTIKYRQLLLLKQEIKSLKEAAYGIQGNGH